MDESDVVIVDSTSGKIVENARYVNVTGTELSRRAGAGGCPE